MNTWDEAFNSLFVKNAEEDSCRSDVTTPLPTKADGLRRQVPQRRFFVKDLLIFHVVTVPDHRVANKLENEAYAPCGRHDGVNCQCPSRCIVSKSIKRVRVSEGIHYQLPELVMAPRKQFQIFRATPERCSNRLASVAVIVVHQDIHRHDRAR